ncbi:MAG TPA: tetratricopeptide repeat protein [Bacteroidia bacterium]|nr:tetratricopeptide repeat protein [Bacteroidia bacterium]
MNRKVPIALFMFLLLPFTGFAQAKSKAQMIDSLEKVVATRPDDTLKVSAYERLCWELKNTGKYKESVERGMQGKALAEKLNDSLGISAMCNDLGVVYYRLGEYDSAVAYHNRSLEIRSAMNDSSNMAMSYNNLGLVYNDQGNYSLALEYFLASLTIKEKIGDKSGVVSALGNIGIVYSGLDQPDTSLVYFERALKIAEEIDDKRAIAFSSNNIGIIWFKRKQYDKALKHFQDGLAAKIVIDDKRGIASSRVNIGSVYDVKGLMEEALVEFDTALAMFRRMGDPEGITSACNLKANTLFKMKRYDEALALFQEAYDLGTKRGNLPEVQNACEGLALVYEAKGNFPDAFKYYKQYSELKDSLLNEETTRKAVTAQLSYDYDKKTAVAKAEEAAKETIRAEEARRQQVYFWFVSGILVLVILLAIFIFKGYREKQKANLELDDKNQKIENAYRIIEHKNKEITDSINYAQGIQNAILPEKEVVEKYLPDSFVLYTPKDIVGGDFYYLEKGANENVFVAAADCTGHGVPGAFMSLICSRELKLANTISGSPGKILTLVNKGVKETLRQNNLDSTRDGMDIALIRVSPQQVVFAGANRPLWILRSGSSEMEELKPTKVAIGGHTPDEQVFDEQSVNLAHGDVIYLFSDGFADQFGGDKGKKLTTKKFRELLLGIHHKPMHEQKNELERFINQWRGPVEQIDDLLVIGIRV